MHASRRVFGVFAGRKPGYQFTERFKRLTRGLGIAVGEIVFADQAIEESGLFVVARQALQIIGIIHMRMSRMRANEAVGAGNGRGRLLIFVIGVSNLELRLFGIGAVRVARFQSFEMLDGGGIVFTRQGVFTFGVETLRGPVFSGI